MTVLGRLVSVSCGTCPGYNLPFKTCPDIQVVGSAGSGEEALEKTEALSPQLVLMDLQLLGMGGLETTQRLRLRHPQIQVIIVTSHDGVHMREECLKRGAQAFVSKHGSPRVLLSKISRLFREP